MKSDEEIKSLDFTEIAELTLPELLRALEIYRVLVLEEKEVGE